MTGTVRLATVAPVQRRFAGYAWGLLVFNLAVIMWGTVVRATGSGAGCGANWPECDGAVIPSLADSETAIEFAHRATSGLALLGALALVIWAYRLFPAGLVRKAAAAVAILTILEALIGAALVLFGWVEDDSSVGRIVTIAVHQANTLALIGALTLAAWWSSGGAAPRSQVPSKTARSLATLGIALVFVAALGAITALGDTLFPAESLSEGLKADASAQAQVLVRLRVIHPVLAIITAVYAIVVARRLEDATDDRNTEVFSAAVIVIVALQLVAGVVNVALLAPLWMQLVHLLLADLLTIAVVLLAAAAVATETDRSDVPNREAAA